MFALPVLTTRSADALVLQAEAKESSPDCDCSEPRQQEQEPISVCDEEMEKIIEDAALNRSLAMQAVGCRGRC